MISPAIFSDWNNTVPAPEPGVSIKHDIIEMAVRACLEEFTFDISVLEKVDQDRIYVAILDAWPDWPENDGEAYTAAVDALRSIAVADGWEECILP